MCEHVYVYTCVRDSREWIIMMKIEDHNFTGPTDAHVNAP